MLSRYVNFEMACGHCVRLKINTNKNSLLFATYVYKNGRGAMSHNENTDIKNTNAN